MTGSFTSEQLQRLYEVSRAIHSTLESTEALRLIVREAVSLMGASSGSLALVNPTTGLLEIAASEGLPEDASAMSLRPKEGITGWVAHHGEPLRIGDVSADERYISARPEVRSELAVPLFIEEDVRAVLNVDAESVDAFSETDQKLLEELARHATQVIVNTWQYEQHRQRAELLRSLVSVGQTINSNLHLDEVLESITREAAGLGRVKMCSLQLLDPSEEWLEMRAQFGAGTDYRQRPPLSVVESLMGSVVRRRKPMQVLNVQTSAQYQHPETARREGLVSLLCAPLVFGDQSLGTLSVYTEAPHVFSNEEVRTLSALAELSAVAIEKARLYERTVDVEEQLRRNEQLSALGLLAAEVAHEIRNPLTVMKMLYHSMELDFAEGDPRAEDARVLDEKMNHLDQIVDNIVKFARNAEPQMGPVDIPSLLDDLSLLTRHKLQHQQITLVREDAPDLPPVKGDATQLSQAFLNLILNAAEAMQHGGKLQIATTAVEQGVTVTFTDSGPGMTEEQREYAFTGMLSSTKDKGGGLGLAIVAKVVEAHGGRVEVESAPDEGTRIILRLHA
ncbi:MAG TPA: histidine kinase [Verrucomicrobiales bacterium]|nr:histidine kinase [Verrucomicrobiales bacterium]